MFSKKKSNKVFLALGSNVDTDTSSRFQFLTLAIDELYNHPKITLLGSSKVYETLPVGYLDQTNFLNAVVEISTSLTPIALLEFIKGTIEPKSGRVKTVANGPRTLDVDILLFEDKQVETDFLQIPHPRLFERAFVLVPLSDIAKEIVGDIALYDLVDSIDGVLDTSYDLKEYVQTLLLNEKSSV